MPPPTINANNIALPREQMLKLKKTNPIITRLKLIY